MALTWIAKTRIISTLCCSLIFCLSDAMARPSASATTITQGIYHGWLGAYRISNGVVDVVVVPQIGRIMAFEFMGQPDTNALFNNAIWEGKSAPATPDPADPKTFPKDWRNIGGDKVWPSPQDDWPQRQPVGWPPDPSFDTGPYRLTRLPDGVRLTGPISPYFGIRHVRDIILTPGSATLHLHDTFLKVAGPPGPPLGIWSISQVRGDSTVYLPLDRHGLFPGLGLTPLQDSKPSMPNWQPQGDILAVTRPSGIGTKVGVDDSEGWMACLYGGDLLFSEHFSRSRHARYPDKGVNAEVFTNGDDSQAYLEMEALGPLVSLKSGQRLSRDIIWRLERLPQAPRNGEAALAAVKTAMRKPDSMLR
jgi:hypothetical protein